MLGLALLPAVLLEHSTGPTPLLARSAAAAPGQRALPIADRDVYPESIAAGPDGTLYVGSVGQPYIYRARRGAGAAERWIDLRPFGSSSYGVLADARSRTLWACTVVQPKYGGRAPPLDQRRTTLRAFDLRSGKAQGAWPLPGASNACNDIAIGPDRSVYLSDIGNGRILRLAGGALELWFAGPEASRVDGVTFIGRDFYFSNLETGRIYRLPIGPDRAAGRPVEILLSEKLGGPDGVRAANGRLYVADNRRHEMLELSLRGDRATVRTLASGLQVPTGVAPAPGRLWYSEMKANYWSDPALAGADPNPFLIRSVPLAR